LTEKVFNFFFSFHSGKRNFVRILESYNTLDMPYVNIKNGIVKSIF